MMRSAWLSRRQPPRRWAPPAPTRSATGLYVACGRQCVDLGVDIRIITEALGHESLESTKIYTQVSFQRTRRIAELFGPPGELK
jgi:hypothetical protein